jgi:hypothetical protein
MTTSVKIASANYPALVRFENLDANGASLGSAREQVLIPSDGEQTFHCHVGMRITVQDIAYNDERVPEHYRRKDLNT